MLKLIHGENTFASEEALRVEINKVEHQNISGDTAHNITDLIFSSSNLSLFSQEQKLIIIRNLSKNRKKSLMNELSEYIIENYSVVNLILFENIKFDARTKLYKIIKKYGEIVECEVLNTADLKSWISLRLKNMKIKSSTHVAQEIVERVGTNQKIIDNELEKLRLFLASEKRAEVRIEDLDILTKNSEVVIWELMDAISSRNKGVIVKIIDEIFQAESDYPYLSTMLAKQLKLIYWMKCRDISEEEMKTEFKVHPYTISKVKRHIHLFDERLIKLLYAKLTSLDFKVKQGRIDAKLGLIMLFAGV